MVDLLLVRRLPPLHKNLGKRLIKSPKVHIRDSGLLHALLGVNDKEALLGHPVIGMSWEGFVIEDILNTIDQKQDKPYFYRTSSSNEIDLIVERSEKETWAIEVKKTLAPQFTNGHRLVSQDIAASRNFIIYPGTERFPLAENTEAVGLADFLNALTMSR